MILACGGPYAVDAKAASKQRLPSESVVSVSTIAISKRPLLTDVR